MAPMLHIHTFSLMALRIGQLNAQGSMTVMDQIRKYAEEEELDILCMQ